MVGEAQQPPLGYGYGDGDGDSDSNGHGYGHGYGYGSGDGSGYGSGYGNSVVFVAHETPIAAYWSITTRQHFGADVVPAPGAVMEWPYLPVLCEHGLHASVDANGARGYGNGALWRVSCSGWVRMGKDKLVCTRRVFVELVT